MENTKKLKVCISDSISTTDCLNHSRLLSDVSILYAPVSIEATHRCIQEVFRGPDIISQ